MKIKGFFFPKLVAEAETPPKTTALSWERVESLSAAPPPLNTGVAIEAAQSQGPDPGKDVVDQVLQFTEALRPKTQDDDDKPAVSVPSTAPKPSAGFTPLTEVDGSPVFQVFVLGTRGSGKTVFLASLYKLLSTQDNSGNSFRLICKDAKSLRQLNETYRRLASPNQEWPPGSYSIQEYIFDCVHSQLGKDIELFKFRYFDFPGGFVSDTQRPEDLQFVLDQVRAAHSVLVLLDGMKIKNILEKKGESAGNPSLYEDLDMLMDIVQNCVGKPMHFAITKADVLSPKRHPLVAIRQALLKHRGFANIISQQVGKQPVHLLPVSAIGSKFAKLDPETQQMKKLPNGIIEPSYVDLSLTFTIIDYLSGIAEELVKELPENCEDTLVRSWFYKKVLAYIPYTVLGAGPVVSVGGQLLHLAALSNPVVQVLISGASLLGVRAAIKAGSDRIKTRIEAFRDEIERTSRNIKDRHSAAEAVIRIQLMMARRFKDRFPDSEFGASGGAQR